MPVYHKDSKISIHLSEVIDGLCLWERETGRQSALILIPETEDEKIVLIQNGKPVPLGQIIEVFAISLARRLKIPEDEILHLIDAIGTEVASRIS